MKPVQIQKSEYFNSKRKRQPIAKTQVNGTTRFMRVSGINFNNKKLKYKRENGSIALKPCNKKMNTIVPMNRPVFPNVRLIKMETV